jgi:hypothetical protein
MSGEEELLRVAAPTGDIWRFGVHLILSNPFKYPFPKILYHDGEFSI